MAINSQMQHVVTKLVFVSLVTFLIVTSGLAQGKTFKIGVEFQAYPTGAIPGIRADMFLSDYSKVHIRLGYNIVRHGDAGEHQDERGGGPGATLGYDILPAANHRWTLGLRADLWYNQVDWYDIPDSGAKVQGKTDVTILQPTIQAGFRLPSGERLEFIPTLAFGYEINIVTRGEDVGQGPVLLAGLIVNFEL